LAGSIWGNDSWWALKENGQLCTFRINLGNILPGGVVYPELDIPGDMRPTITYPLVSAKSFSGASIMPTCQLLSKFFSECIWKIEIFKQHWVVVDFIHPFTTMYMFGQRWEAYAESARNYWDILSTRLRVSTPRGEVVVPIVHMQTWACNMVPLPTAAKIPRLSDGKLQYLPLLDLIFKHKNDPTLDLQVTADGAGHTKLTAFGDTIIGEALGTCQDLTPGIWEFSVGPGDVLKPLRIRKDRKWANSVEEIWDTLSSRQFADQVVINK
jgi:hypothetical protein